MVIEDGEQAIEFVDKIELSPNFQEPCVILLDLHLPKRDGLEVLSTIRGEPAMSHVHVVLVSTSACPGERAAIHAVGGELRIKPTKIAEFGGLAADLMNICKSSVT